MAPMSRTIAAVQYIDETAVNMFRVTCTLTGNADKEFKLGELDCDVLLMHDGSFFLQHIKMH